MTLAEMKTKLAAMESDYDELVQEYNIVGSHSVKKSDLEKQRQAIRILERRIRRWCGYTGRTYAEYN